MRRMTKPMATPSKRALARKDTTPKPKPKVRGSNRGRGVAVALAFGIDTSNLSAEEMAEVIDPDKPLTDKQKLFVQHWAKGDSITSASYRAGYSNTKVAYQLVKMPNILKLKAEHEAKWEATGAMTRQKVMDGMLEAIEMARMMAEPSSMIAGWREIGKICGYYATVEHRVKVDVTGNVIVDRMNSLSDAELLKIIQGGAQAALQGT